jgi:hypothetical protein
MESLSIGDRGGLIMHECVTYLRPKTEGFELRIMVLRWPCSLK